MDSEHNLLWIEVYINRFLSFLLLNWYYANESVQDHLDILKLRVFA